MLTISDLHSEQGLSSFEMAKVVGGEDDLKVGAGVAALPAGRAAATSGAANDTIFGVNGALANLLGGLFR